MAARIIPLEGPDHPELEPYAAVRERDLARRDGLFVAEGEVVLRVLASRSRLRIRSLLLERRRVDSVRDLLESLDESVPAYVVPQDVMDGVVGFAIHRGVLALGERGEETSAPSLVAGASLLVAMIGLTNHDNVGGIFRNAAAFGADGVLLDATTCDPLYRKAIRVSAGAALVVPFARVATVDELFEALAAADIEPIALTPRGEETIEQLPPRRRALLLGTEGPGLPDHVLERTRRVRIDMVSGMDSLNVAVTSGIALHAARRSRAR